MSKSMKTKVIGQCKDCEHADNHPATKKIYICQKGIDSAVYDFDRFVYDTFGCWYWKEKK